MVAPPTELTCGMTKFFFGFCFTLCYAAIVTKTNRIARIFNSSIQKVHKRFTSPQSQLLITGLLTSVEILINTAWLIMDPPKVIQVLPAQDQRLKICSGLGDFSYIISLSYPFILIGICTAYAFKTRKCPEGFNEARHIAFTNYTAIIIWIAFVPLYLASTNNAVCIVTLAMSLSVSGLVQLCCLFLPKIYIVIFTPEKNTKEVVMAHSRTYSVSSPNSASTPFDSNTYFSSNNGYIHGMNKYLPSRKRHETM
ncbi:metabotropic glutamate receptor-like [Lycorma delicatula]|uniref:metabotropic glutamate receptor-like n=1 Tax=Lycorma delicatula TaxID=130591 RepID=UPI003F5143B0